MVSKRLRFGSANLSLSVLTNQQQKIKALTRPTASAQAPGSSVARQPRNLDPALHPFERSREYTRALNATKLERMFAKPFIAQLGKGHVRCRFTVVSGIGNTNLLVRWMESIQWRRTLSGLERSLRGLAMVL